MARKLVDADKKWAAVLRVLQQGALVKDEARRCSVTRQAFERWIRQYKKAHPDADKRPPPSAAPPPPPPPPDAPPAAPAAPEPGDSPPAAVVDEAAAAAAREADGEISTTAGPDPKPGAGGPTPPPPPGQLSLDTSKDDMEVVEGIGNQVLGLACRGMVIFLEIRAGVRIPEAAMKRIQEVYVLTSTERAMLRPASAHLARKIRELIGSNENVALTVGGSTVAQGLWDRWRIVAEAVAAEFMVQRPDLKAAAAAEERRKAEGAK